ncbi:MAG: hypothetical protein ACSHUF_00180 [Candidatus Nasuia deltocephalinicola]
MLKKIIWIFMIIIKKNNFKNIYGNIKNEEEKNIKLKNKKIKKIIIRNGFIYFGYSLCSNNCPKTLKKIKKIKKDKSFVLICINKNENQKITEKNLNKIKKNKIYIINNNKKIINEKSKNYKIIYKYKKIK